MWDLWHSDPGTPREQSRDPFREPGWPGRRDHRPSDPARLRDRVGPSRARMILMAGARIDADQALAWPPTPCPPHPAMWPWSRRRS
ncbi:hypothetical protein EYF88_03855 [Paracoccus sediminis]|uniref:Uncharacterized protein n=1 Tax=Paracoccus sediminis TaxID=1214787 RepID=A0ABY1YMV2_9RHOB|nr:hypothetical protein EYF88_03855 [Paracoccus sediminis]